MGFNQSQTQNSFGHQVAAIVLAAGQGTRMKSSTPKVLHNIAGRSMIIWVLDALERSGIEKCVLVTSPTQASEMAKIAGGVQKTVCIQKQPRGTGDAVASAALGLTSVKVPTYSQGELYQGLPVFADYVLLCAGDTPCLAPEELKSFAESSMDKDLQVLGMQLPNPYGYGRLVTEGDKLVAITEEKDCSPLEKQIHWVNSGIYCVRTSLLFEWLESVKPENAQNEYYLTDIVKVALNQTFRKNRVGWAKAAVVENYGGVNDRVQLAEAEKILVHRIRTSHMVHGVRFLLPETVYVEYGIKIGPDSEIGSGCALLGKTEIGMKTEIGHNVILRAARIGNHCKIGDGCVLEKITIADGEWVPPGTIRIGAGGF
jgi:bifunctional UDP-N-acetylglucosamine pyrophosphorylase/glucosamine-1-phosphate N-acetyltransferase